MAPSAGPRYWTRWVLLLPSAVAETGAALLQDYCPGGVQVEDAEIVFEGEDGYLRPAAQARLTGYAPGPRESHLVASRTLRSALDRLEGEVLLELSTVEEEDWANQWREHFTALRIGRFLIAPSWEKADNEPGTPVLSLDPGMAFGTGRHPTTRMCLELLDQTLSADAAGQQVLDVGCGSGILALAAAATGATVTASDPDAWCMEASNENAERNGCRLELVQAAGLGWCRREFDVVVANLMSNILLELAPDLWRVTRPGGTLIVSGISQPRAPEVLARLQGAGFILQKERCECDVEGGRNEWWVAFALQHP